jgi:hypothetical protein
MQCDKKLNLAQKVVYRNYDKEICSLLLSLVPQIRAGCKDGDFSYHLICGHRNEKHKDNDKDLINASEKEDKTLFSYVDEMKKIARQTPIILTCPACAVRQALTLGSNNYFKCRFCNSEFTLESEQIKILQNLICCKLCNEEFELNKIHQCKKEEPMAAEKEIEKITDGVRRWWHFAKQKEEVMKNACHTCCIVFSSEEELTRHNQNKVKGEIMKHPCGKVFDVVKDFKFNADDSTAMVEFFETSDNYIIVKNKHKGLSVHHLSCGCDVKDSEHRGYYINLVNVPEVREVDLEKIFLQKMDKGEISIRYKDQEYNWFLFKILKNGTIVRNGKIPSNLGFQLDEQGRIKLEE